MSARPLSEMQIAAAAKEQRMQEHAREMYNALEMVLRADEVATGKHRGTLTIHHVAKVARAILARIDGAA